MAVNVPVVQTPIPILFGEAVKATERVLLPYLKTVIKGVEGITYMYGHPLEIVNRLIEKNQTLKGQFSKYPLVALFMDFAETFPGTGYRTQVRLRIVITNTSSPKLRAEERYEKNLIPILLPIYEELLRQVARLPAFKALPGRIPHTKYDRPFWGREGLYGKEGNIFADVMDCVEIQNLELNVLYLNPLCVSEFTNL